MGKYILSCKTAYESISLMVEQVSNLGFEFCLLAGGLNGMDHHVWRYRETHFIELNKVCCTPVFLEL